MTYDPGYTQMDESRMRPCRAAFATRRVSGRAGTLLGMLSALMPTYRRFSNSKIAVKCCKWAASCRTRLSPAIKCSSASSKSCSFSGSRSLDSSGSSPTNTDARCLADFDPPTQPLHF